MDHRRAFDLGLAAGLLAMLAVDALRWLIGFWTPDVSTGHLALVLVQLVVAAAGAIWLLFRRARLAKVP